MGFNTIVVILIFLLSLQILVGLLVLLFFCFRSDDRPSTPPQDHSQTVKPPNRPVSRPPYNPPYNPPYRPPQPPAPPPPPSIRARNENANDRVSIFSSEYEQKQAGARGEKLAERYIHKVLRRDDRHFLNVNLNYNGQRTEIDSVVVNTCGVFIFEVKNYTGTLYGDPNDETWKKYRTNDVGNTYEKEVRNPVRQVNREVSILKRCLVERGINVWIEGYVFLVGGYCDVATDRVLTTMKQIDAVIHTPGKRPLTPQEVQYLSMLFR